MPGRTRASLNKAAAMINAPACAIPDEVRALGAPVRLPRTIAVPAGRGYGPAPSSVQGHFAYGARSCVDPAQETNGRPVRHLPRRPHASRGRLCRGEAAGGRRVHRRGSERRPAADSRRSIPATGARRAAIAERIIAAFSDYDYVVAPSGSCAGMIKAHYPELFADDPELARKAERARRQDVRADELPGRRPRRRPASTPASTAS